MDKATAFLTTEAVDASVRSVVLQGTTLDQFRYVVEILTAAATRDAFVEDGGLGAARRIPIRAQQRLSLLADNLLAVGMHNGYCDGE